MIFSLAGEGQLIPVDGWITLLDEIGAKWQFPSKGVETRVAAAMLVAVDDATALASGRGASGLSARSR